MLSEGVPLTPLQAIAGSSQRFRSQCEYITDKINLELRNADLTAFPVRLHVPSMCDYYTEHPEVMKQVEEDFRRAGWDIIDSKDAEFWVMQPKEKE